MGCFFCLKDEAKYVESVELGQVLISLINQIMSLTLARRSQSAITLIFTHPTFGGLRPLSPFSFLQGHYMTPTQTMHSEWDISSK